MAMSQALDARAEWISEGAGWREAHVALSRLARERAAVDAEEGRWLLAARRTEAHRHLGHGSFVEYVGRLFGYSPRTVHEKLRVAEALEGLPALNGALTRGELGWSSVRELTRVARPETEHAWLDAARGRTLRELEALIAGKAPGARPGGPSCPELRRHVLRFEVGAETFALLREAISQVKRQGGGSLNDDDALLTLARQALGGPSDDGGASYQIAIDVCAQCGRGEQHSNGEAIGVSPAAVDVACCDGQHLGRALESPANENATGTAKGTVATLPGTTEPSGTSDTAQPGETGEVTPSPAPSEPRSERPGPAHVGTPAPLLRASQTVPPAVRRAVLRRDHHCCRVPGCRHAIFVDVHHVRPRAEVGFNTPENLITLCAAHHRAVHEGKLVIRGSGRALSFHHADGTTYGEAPDAERADALGKVFSAPRQLGFREREVRTVLSELRGDAMLRQAPVSDLLRQALMRIRGSAR